MKHNLHLPPGFPACVQVRRGSLLASGKQTGRHVTFLSFVRAQALMHCGSIAWVLAQRPIPITR